MDTELPVAFEPVLAGPFAEKFRDMEFLNRAKHDETAIPYEEKLKKYTQSILVGGELAGQLGTPEAWEKLSLICSRLGDLCGRNGPALDKRRKTGYHSVNDNREDNPHAFQLYRGI